MYQNPLCLQTTFYHAKTVSGTNTSEEQRDCRRLQKYHRATIELVRACVEERRVEERRRTHTEENVENGYTKETEERTTENKRLEEVLV